MQSTLCQKIDASLAGATISVQPGMLPRDPRRIVHGIVESAERIHASVI